MRMPNVTIKKHSVQLIIDTSMDEYKKYEVKHHADKDYQSVRNSVNKASKDEYFISKVVEKLDTVKFPAYKHQILDVIQRKSSDENVIGLLNSLNESVLFKDKYDVKHGLEQENSKSKQQNQMSDSTRKNLKVELPDPTQKRKDYPEIPATTMKNYVCNFCGKDFQSKDQLTKHQEFEFKDKNR